MTPAVVFESVSKKFRRGERHDSLRDLVPSLVRRAFRGRPSDALSDQEFWALRNVSFEVAAGEALAIIGANGAGKSTTLKVLTRILKPTAGRCAVTGRVGALIEVAAGFHPDLTGRENIFLQGAIMGMTRLEIAARFDEIVEFAGVEPFIGTPVKRYSSGMNARLGFSIAAHFRPDVLIIDEVLSVGDTAFQQKCFDRMRAFIDHGVAVVFVTHNLAAASQLCKRALLLVRGETARLGPTNETLAAYCGIASPSTSETTTGSGVALRADVHERPRDGMWMVNPGALIRLSVHVAFHESLEDASIGVVVWDMARNLYVYGVSSDALGLPPVRGPKGEHSSYDFEFRANLARGTYALEVNLFDRASQRSVAVLKPVAQFTVVENITYDGVANLFLSGTRVGHR